MLTMTGKQVREQGIQETIQVDACECTSEDRSITLSLSTKQGYKIEMVFTSPKRKIYAKFAEMIWTKVITTFQLLDGQILYLTPKEYWYIYKKTDLGKSFLTLTGARLYVNGANYTFPNTDFYFNSAAIPAIKGVYAIYTSDNTLLYIGSATDVPQRWKEHDSNFRDSNSNLNKMYAYYQGCADDIVYKLLLDNKTLSKELKIEVPSIWLFELIEYGYIKLLCPPYNKEGICCPFSFKAGPGDLPVDYWKIMRGLLTEERYKEYFRPQEIYDEKLPPEPICFDSLAGVEEEPVEIEITED